MSKLPRRLTLAVLTLLIAAPAAFAQAQISTSVFYGSPYVWRGEVLSTGYVFQPAVSASYGDFSLTFFGNIDPNSAAVGQKAHFNEADLTASYDVTAGGVSLGAGYTFYTFPTPADGELDLAPTQEVFAAVSFDEVPLAPALFVAYDFDAFDGIYAQADIGRGVSVAGHPFALGASLGFDGAYVLDDGEAALSHLALTLGTDLPAGALTLSPMIGFQAGLADAYRAAYGKTLFYGGIGIGL